MVKITGDQRHLTRLKGKFSPRKLAIINAKLFEAGQEVQISAQISITTGAVSGANHKPSAPGEPPNNDTGVLANSIEVNPAGPGKVEVSANAPYAAAQEFGNSRLPARPYMRPALQAKRVRISELIKEAIDVAEG